jgi:hypothetical protein
MKPADGESGAYPVVLEAASLTSAAEGAGDRGTRGTALGDSAAMRGLPALAVAVDTGRGSGNPVRDAAEAVAAARAPTAAAAAAEALDRDAGLRGECSSMCGLAAAALALARARETEMYGLSK